LRLRRELADCHVLDHAPAQGLMALSVMGVREGWARHAAGDSPSHHGHGAGYGFATQPCSGGAIFLMASIAPIITSAFRTPAFRRLVAISCCASAC
jgi:hypothetical protein